MTTTSFLKINHIGNPGNVGAPGTIEGLLTMLATHPLDPKFEQYGNFITPSPRASRHAGYDETGEAIYVETGPAYDECPDAVQFWGNFWDWSFCFMLATDDADLTQRLTAAIRANQATATYRAAKLAAR